ncbi:MAG: hypothetical protein AB7O59_24790 [Pirellulales bacterium]
MIKRFGRYATSKREDWNGGAAEEQLSAPSPRILLKQVEHFVVAHPKQSLIVALTAGVVLGWMSKRR